MIVVPNPWTELPERPPYVLECDKREVTSFNQGMPPPNHVIQLGALPEPFLGNPGAPVVILNLNPGHSAEDPMIHAQPHFARASRDNLLHLRQRYPLYLLDPDLPSPGQSWWERALGRLIEAVGRERVAQNVFVAEYFPYHTMKYNHRRLRVTSQDYTFFLVRRALERQALVIFFRSFDAWCSAIPALKGYSRSAFVQNVQRPSVSEGNLPGRFAEIAALVRGT